MIFSCCARLRAVGPRPTARSAFAATLANAFDASDTAGVDADADGAADVVTVVVVEAPMELLKRAGASAERAVGRVVASARSSICTCLRWTRVPARDRKGRSVCVCDVELGERYHRSISSKSETVWPTLTSSTESYLSQLLDNETMDSHCRLGVCMP